MKRRFWSEQERDYLRRNYPDRPTIELAAELGRKVGHLYSQAQKLGLEKSQAYLSSPAACRLRRGDNVGAACRFGPGHVPANKGLRRPGWSPGRMRETQFRKGERRGVAVELYKPIGTERISKDGYLERKINDGLPLQKRWRAVHLIIWEEAHGPLPPGYAVVFKNGNKSEIGSLRTRQYIEGSGDLLVITSGGVSALGNYDPLPTGDALRQHWFAKLSKAERLILEVALEHPDGLSKEQVAAATGYEASGGGFNNALGKLRTLELIHGRGEIRPSETFFD